MVGAVLLEGPCAQVANGMDPLLKESMVGFIAALHIIDVFGGIDVVKIPRAVVPGSIV